MREITIKIEEVGGPGKVRVTTYFGDESKACKAENIVADNLVPLIQESLRLAMPQCLTGAGQGNSIEEAQRRCDIETDIRKAGNDRPKP